MPTFPSSTLETFTTRALQSLGVAPDDAHTVARGLVGANLRGHDSHGIMRLLQYVQFVREGAYDTNAPLTIEHETPAVLVCDAGWNFGQVQAHKLLDLLVPKAESLGIAAGTARRCGHIGRLGEYAERAAEHGLILIATVNNDGSGRRVAPPGGIEPRLGTNPLCVGVPNADTPVVLDFGTSVVAEGKVRAYNLDGRKPVPDGWLLDPEGNPTNDPAALYSTPQGSILPVGGAQAYKGFGLAFVLDLLSAGLSGGRSCFADSPAVRGNNVLFVLLNPRRFAGTDHLQTETVSLSAFIRDTPRKPTTDSILLPGDPERLALETRTREGIPIPDGHLTKLNTLASELNIPPLPTTP